MPEVALGSCAGSVIVPKVMPKVALGSDTGNVFVWDLSSLCR